MDTEVTSAATAPELAPQAGHYPEVWRVSSKTISVDVHGQLIEEPEPAAQDWIAANLDVIKSLRADWDGYGADPIHASRISVMDGLLRQFLPVNAQIGSIVPGADGSLQAEWHLRRVEFGLLVEENKITAWVLPRGGVEVERTGLAGLELFRAVAQVELA